MSSTIAATAFACLAVFIGDVFPSCGGSNRRPAYVYEQVEACDTEDDLECGCPSPVVAALNNRFYDLALADPIHSAIVDCGNEHISSGAFSMPIAENVELRSCIGAIESIDPGTVTELHAILDSVDASVADAQLAWVECREAR